MKTDDLAEIDLKLRRGEVPEGWMPAVEGSDPSTVLIMIWAARLSRRVDAFYQEALRPYGFQYSDYAVLFLLRLSGPMAPTRLNAHLAISSGGLTKTIQRLEQQKLVGREPDPDDGRGTLISITKEGERRVARVFADDVSAHEDLLRDLSRTDRKRIASALRDLLDVFEQGA
jgi:DNA-binding MarR family transcriptional regulator